MLHQYRSLEALEDKLFRERKKGIGNPVAAINERPGFRLRNHPPARILPAEAGGLEHSILSMLEKRPGLRKGPTLSIANLTKTPMSDRLVKQCDILVDGEAIGTLTIHTRKVQGGMRILNMLYQGTIPGYENARKSGCEGAEASDVIAMQSAHDPPPVRMRDGSHETAMLYVVEKIPNNTETAPLFRRDYHHELGLATHEYVRAEREQPDTQDTSSAED